ncbi:MAG: two-component system, OmpR family, phosphate regulon response regulator PhoB [Solirubrobacteraceae bacterium]|nr:two-component system, OmpR family, phosphate regulon response regulator PhoB [Solirubrobacteraceae bacterium]
MQPITLLIATADQPRREFLAHQLDADGHTIHHADSPEATTAMLSAHAIDVMLLGDFDSPAHAPSLLRSLRAGQQHTRIHPAQPVVTIGDDSELATFRAYEAGSDHHLTADSAYLVVRAVICAVARRTLDQLTSRHLHVGALHIDTAARSVDIDGRSVKLSRLEFELLCQLATDPTRVFAKSELMQAVWGYSAPQRTRTLDSHACRLRTKLASEGGDGWIANRWGHGYKLLDTQ